MEDKEQHRRFFTDKDYQKNVKKEATWELEYQINHSGYGPNHPVPGEIDDYYHPQVDMPDTVAAAIISELNGRSAISLDFEPEINHEIADTIAEIVRQGMRPDNNIYERTPALEPSSYTPLNNRVLKSTDGFVQPPQVREFLFDALIDTAIKHGQAPGDYTPVERCIRAVHSAVNIIDGGEGNRPDGDGLPLIQMVLSPHPDYMRGLTHGHDIEGFGDNLVDYGMLGTNDYQTGMARAFENRYEERFEEQIQNRQARAARDLFKD